MKIALLALLGLVVGALGGAALGIGAGLAWVQIFRTAGLEEYNGMLISGGPSAFVQCKLPIAFRANASI